MTDDKLSFGRRWHSLPRRYLVVVVVVVVVVDEKCLRVLVGVCPGEAN